MNRQQRRASHANGLKLQRKEWNEFEDVSDRIFEVYAYNPKKPDKAYLNNQYSVQVFYNRECLGIECTKLMIRRNDSKAIYDWQALQRIKNELFGQEAKAFQMFPSQSELVDDYNLYWMWVVK